MTCYNRMPGHRTICHAHLTLNTFMKERNFSWIGTENLIIPWIMN